MEKKYIGCPAEIIFAPNYCYVVRFSDGAAFEFENAYACLEDGVFCIHTIDHLVHRFAVMDKKWIYARTVLEEA